MFIGILWKTLLFSFEFRMVTKVQHKTRIIGGCVFGGVASVIAVRELVLASVGVVSSRMVGINRLFRASLNFCCCLACWLIASCRSSLQFRRSSDWLISSNITLCLASVMGVGSVDICAI